MRKISLPLLGLAMTLLLAGCGPDAAESSRPPEPSPAASAASTPPPSEDTPEPTPVPTPTPEPTPEEPSQEIEEGGYFDNALFVGDSIMEGIRQYTAAQRQERDMLGAAQFLTTTMGVSLADLVGDRDLGVYFSYKGEEKPLEDIVTDIAPRRVFLLLGLNDLASDPEPVVEDIVDRYARLIDNLQTARPGMECIIITNPPKVASQWLPDYTANRHFNNELIGQFAAALIQMCQEQGVPYVDAYEALKDERGALPDDFCRDGFIHLNHQGAAVVVQAVEAFAEGR